MVQCYNNIWNRCCIISSTAHCFITICWCIYFQQSSTAMTTLLLNLSILLNYVLSWYSRIIQTGWVKTYLFFILINVLSLGDWHGRRPDFCLRLLCQATLISEITDISPLQCIGWQHCWRLGVWTPLCGASIPPGQQLQLCTPSWDSVSQTCHLADWSARSGVY